MEYYTTAKLEIISVYLKIPYDDKFLYIYNYKRNDSIVVKDEEEFMKKFNIIIKGDYFNDIPKRSRSKGLIGKLTNEFNVKSLVLNDSLKCFYKECILPYTKIIAINNERFIDEKHYLNKKSIYVCENHYNIEINRLIGIKLEKVKVD